MILRESFLSQLYRRGQKSLSNFLQVTQLQSDGANLNLGSLSILTLGSKLYMMWKRKEIKTLQGTVNNYPRHFEAQYGLQSRFLGLVCVSTVCTDDTDFSAASIMPVSWQQLTSHNEERIRTLTGQIQTESLATGGWRERISCNPLSLPSSRTRLGSAWDQAFGANVQLRLELMVHWFANVPGAASYVRYVYFSFLVFFGTVRFTMGTLPHFQMIQEGTCRGGHCADSLNQSASPPILSVQPERWRQNRPQTSE